LNAKQHITTQEEGNMTTKVLLEHYYEGLARKKGWEVYLTDDFKFVGGDMTNTAPTVGKAAYIEVINRLSRLFTNCRVKEMYVTDATACVRANYDWVFPGGKEVNADVAEFWTVKNGKLDALTIFFDTLSFQTLTKK
jgi:ketosteroid isomerase-like protein